MPDANENPRTRRFNLRWVLGALAMAAVLLAIFAAASFWFVHTPGFQSWLRQRFAHRLELITGGRVELGALKWKLGLLEFEARNLTIHGLEPEGEIPYAHVDRLAVRLKILSLFRREVGLRYVTLDRPILHLIVYPDGSTNQPAPWRPPSTGDSPIEQLFAIDVDRAEIRNGWAIVNQRSWRLDFSADQVALLLSYLGGQSKYQGELRVGKIKIAPSGVLELLNAPAPGAVPDFIQRSGLGARPPAPASRGSWPQGNAGRMPAYPGVAEGRRPKLDDRVALAGSAQAKFSLWRDHLQVDSLLVSAGHSQVKLKCEIREFIHPVLQLSYNAVLDGGELARLVDVSGIRGGVFNLEGQFHGNAQLFATSGKVAVRDLDYADPAFHPDKVTGGATFSLTNERLALPHIFLSLFGGTATGDAEILRWHAPADAKASLAPTGTIHLQTHNLLVPRLASSAATSILPLERMRATGQASGSLASHWRGSPDNLITDMIFVLTPPASPSVGEMPMDALFRATHDLAAGTLRVDQLQLSTGTSQATASGVIDLLISRPRTSPGISGLDATVTTRNLPEVERVMGVLGASSTLPVELHGEASMHGLWSGGIYHARVTGHLEASDLDSLFEEVGAPRRVHWDTAEGEVEFSASLLAARHAVLHRGAAEVDGDAVVSMNNGVLDERSPFTVQASFHNVEVADVLFATGLQAQLGAHDPHFSGKLTADLHVSGTGAHPQAQAHVLVTDAQGFDQPVQRVLGDVQYTQGTIEVSGLQILQYGSTLTGAASLNPVTTAYRFDLHGSHLNLAKVRPLQASHMAVAGRLSFNATGRGTRDAPTVNADVQVSDLILNGERMGGIRAKAVTTGETLQLTAASSAAQSAWTLTGNTHLRGDFPAQLELSCNELGLEPWLRMLSHNRTIGRSAVTGTFQAAGPLRSPRDLSVNGDISSLVLELERVKLHNDGPVRFALAQQILNLQQFHVVGANTSITAGGSFQLTGQRQLDLQARGQVDLKFLENFDATVNSRGSLALDVRANGTADRPLLRGRIDIANAAFSQIDWPNGLSDLNGRLVFNEDRLQIRNLSGKTGGGTLDIGGYISYVHGLNYNLNARGHDVRLRYPPGVSSMAELELRLTGTPENGLLAGDITVTRFEVNPQFDFASYLAKSRPPAVANPDSMLSRIRLDVHLASTPELQVQTSLAKVSGDLDLRLRGTEERPVLLGRVNITEGDISFNGTKYHMERGGITFNNPVTIEPVLDIEATTSVRDYDINLGLHGPLDKLSTTYRSDPPLATADIVSLLAFGRVREDLALQTTSASNLTPEAQTVLYQALNAAVSSRMQKLFGVSRIKIDPQAGAAESNTSGPRLTIEQQVANNITLTYITDVTRANYQTIQAEYNISKNLSVVAVRDWNGVVSFDVRIRQRKR